jgi:cell division protein FtsI/penicillin-binding protein 2
MTDGPAGDDRGIGLSAKGEGLTARGWPVADVLGPAPKRRHRVLLVVVLALALVTALLAAAVVLLMRSSAPDHNRARARAFLVAWSAGNTAQMQSMVTPPAQVAPDLKAVSAFLHLTKSTYTLDGVTKSHGHTTATFTAHDVIDGFGPWTYHGSFELAAAEPEPQVVWNRAVIYPKLGPHDVLNRARTLPTRAAISGANGQLLTSTGPTIIIGAEPDRVGDAGAQLKLAAALHTTLQIDPQSVLQALARAGPTSKQFVPLAEVPDPAYRAVKPTIYPIPGLLFHPSSGITAPSPSFGQPLIGAVGPATAEQLKTLGAPYEAGDQVGQSGLQQAYERSLAGTPTIDIQIVDATITDPKHNVIGVAMHSAGHAPVALQTTIDLHTQQVAEQALAGVTQPAALVAVDAQGNVRAAVSAPATNQFNRALFGTYPPGSTFKVITTDGLLTAGVTPTTTLACPPTITVDGKSFHNFEQESQPQLSLTRAFALSCNTAFIGATQQHLTAAQLHAAATTFGFDQPLHLGLAVVGGSFPSTGDAVETVADAIGQGKVTASPLQMATVAETVMTGQWHPPMLLPQHSTAGPLPAPLDPNVRTELASMMRGVVTSGTGTAANIPNHVISGKTGTAEFGSGPNPATHAWFIGFDDTLAVAVIVEGGGVGGQVAAPLAAKFFAGL